MLEFCLEKASFIKANHYHLHQVAGDFDLENFVKENIQDTIITFDCTESFDHFFQAGSGDLKVELLKKTPLSNLSIGFCFDRFRNGVFYSLARKVVEHYHLHNRLFAISDSDTSQIPPDQIPHLKGVGFDALLFKNDLNQSTQKQYQDFWHLSHLSTGGYRNRWLQPLNSLKT